MTELGKLRSTFLALVLTWPVSFAYANGVVNIESVGGSVTLTHANDLTVSPRAGDVYSLPVDVVTKRNSSLVMTVAASRIEIASDTSVTIPEVPTSGGDRLLNVIQDVGSAFYEIVTGEKSHFSVTTPYLVSVVKGTSFSVDVHDQSTTVSLFEGRLQVFSSDRPDEETYLSPGQIAYRSAGAPLRIFDEETISDPAEGANEIGAAASPSIDNSGPLAVAEPGGGPGVVIQGEVVPTQSPAGVSLEKSVDIKLDGVGGDDDGKGGVLLDVGSDDDAGGISLGGDDGGEGVVPLGGDEGGLGVEPLGGDDKGIDVPDKTG